MPRPVTAVLADLDDTLFDHAHATRGALAHLHTIEPRWAVWTSDHFEARHGEMLELLHQEVLTGRLTVEAARIERFRRLLRAVEVEDRPAAARAVDIALSYREAYEAAWRPVPGARALLEALAHAGIRVAVVTNNLVAEQRLKIERLDLGRYIDALITSEEAGIPKPDPAIFRQALDRLRTPARDAVMIGDAWPTDILGARAAGIRAVWLNRLGSDSPDGAVAELRSLEPVGAALHTLGIEVRDHNRISSSGTPSNPPGR